MPNPRLASRYAKSLLDLALERGELEKVYADMEWLQEAGKSSREFINVLRSPVIKADKKEKIINAVTRDKISELTKAFIRLMIKKSRESFLPEVIPSFITQYKKYKNIFMIKLTTAIPVSEAVKEEIVNRIKQTSKMEHIELETIVNSDIIGGFVLQAG